MKYSIKKRILALFCATLFGLLAISAGASYRQAYETELAKDGEVCSSAANIAARLFDSVGIERLADPANKTLYAQTRSRIRTICRNYSLEYLYLFTVDDQSVLHYIMTVASDDETDKMINETRGLGAQVKAVLDEQELAALRGEKSSYFILRNEFGQDIVWPIPYYNAEGEVCALIGAEISLHMSNQLILRHFLRNYVWIVVLISFTFAALFLIINKKVIKPVLTIAEYMNRFDPAQDTSGPVIRSQDEIRMIADSFETMSDTIRSHIRDIEAMTALQEQEKAQMDIARRIQYGMVPASFAESGDGLEAAALMQPAKEVGGDFYDCFDLKDGRYCALVGDVSGKGVAGALFMAQVKTMLRERMKLAHSPAEVLNRTNDALCASNPEGLFVTVFICILDPVRGEMVYANAGHNPPLLLRKDGPAYLAPDPGIALGLFEDAGIEDASLMLAAGEGILLYTDGITEAVDRDKTFFGRERLLSAVRAAGAEGVCAAVRNAAQTFSNGTEQFDDMTVVSLYYTGRHGEIALPLRLDAFQRVKDTVLSQCQNISEAKKALLACDEALTNIVSYSDASELWFSFRQHTAVSEAVFRDNGKPFDPFAAPQPEKPEFDFLDRGGMGISLIRQIAPDSDWQRKDGYNILTLRFPRASSADSENKQEAEEQ